APRTPAASRPHRRIGPAPVRRARLGAGGGGGIGGGAAANPAEGPGAAGGGGGGARGGGGRPGPPRADARRAPPPPDPAGPAGRGRSSGFFASRARIRSLSGAGTSGLIAVGGSGWSRVNASSAAVVLRAWNGSLPVTSW